MNGDIKTDWNKMKNEKYLVHIGKLGASEHFYVLVPNRRDMAIMLGLLNEDKYVLGQVNVLNLKDFEEFLKELREDNKPPGLSYGEKEEEDR